MGQNYMPKIRDAPIWKFLAEAEQSETLGPIEGRITNTFFFVIDRYWFFITDTDYLYVYVTDNRYAEPIFIYCYKVNK